VGILELLGDGEMALHRARHGAVEDLRNAGAGYLGFPAFALECFTMYGFVRAVAIRLLPGDQTGPHGRTLGL
jgi:hypothetical protein